MADSSENYHTPTIAVLLEETVVENDEAHSDDSDDSNEESGDEMPELVNNNMRLDALSRALRASLRDPEEERPRQESTRDIVSRVTDETVKDGSDAPETIDPDSLRDALQCIVCQEPMYKPTTLLCQHSFCYGCLEANDNRKCPACRMNYVLPAEYNRGMDEVVAKCFPEAHRRAKTEEELHNHAKDARVRIEEELRRSLFHQAAAQAHVEVNNLQENRREVPQAQPRASEVNMVDRVWNNVRGRVPKYVADVIFNPGNVIELLYRSSRYGTFVGLATLASLFTLVFTVKEFSRFAGIFMTFFILAQAGITGLKGLLWFATHAVRNTMMKAFREAREQEQQAVRVNRPAAEAPMIFAGALGPNGVVFPPGQQLPPEIRQMMNALNSLANNAHAHQH